MSDYCEDCWTELPPRRPSGRDRRVCAECRTTRQRRYGQSDEHRNRLLLAEALDELFPLGLTDECPVRREMSRNQHDRR